MKWFGGTLAGVFLGFVIIIVYILFKSGSFKPVNISKSSYGPFVAIYKERLGPYHESSKVLFEVENTLKAHQLLCFKTYGYYIDDPNQTEANRLRSELGCLFPEKFKDQIQDLIVKNNLDLKTKYIDVTNYIAGEFDGSPALVSLKVYPKIKAYAEKNHLQVKSPVLEVYEVQSPTKVKTTVLFEIEPLN